MKPQKKKFKKCNSQVEIFKNLNLISTQFIAAYGLNSSPTYMCTDRSRIKVVPHETKIRFQVVPTPRHVSSTIFTLRHVSAGHECSRESRIRITIVIIIGAFSNATGRVGRPGNTTFNATPPTSR